jgi:hypothetical protein
MLPTKFQFIWWVSEEKIKMWKINRRRTPSDGKSLHCLWQGELKMSAIAVHSRLFNADPLTNMALFLVSSFVVGHLLTFHILIFSSETHQPNELKLSKKHLWKVLSKESKFCYDPLPNMALHRQFLFHRCFLPNFCSFGQVDSEEKIFN